MENRKKRRVGNQHGAPALATIERVGLDAILDRIRSGQSQRQIAEALGIGIASLCKYLADPSRSEQSARARMDSAEAWLDRGMQALEEARGGDAAAVQLARAFEQHCARRAAIANPRYSDKAAIELSGPNGGPIQGQAVVTVYVPANHRDNARVTGCG